MDPHSQGPLVVYIIKSDGSPVALNQHNELAEAPVIAKIEAVDGQLFHLEFVFLYVGFTNPCNLGQILQRVAVHSSY